MFSHKSPARSQKLNILNSPAWESISSIWQNKKIKEVFSAKCCLLSPSEAVTGIALQPLDNLASWLPGTFSSMSKSTSKDQAFPPCLPTLLPFKPYFVFLVKRETGGVSKAKILPLVDKEHFETNCTNATSSKVNGHDMKPIGGPHGPPLPRQRSSHEQIHLSSHMFIWTRETRHSFIKASGDIMTYTREAANSNQSFSAC